MSTNELQPERLLVDEREAARMLAISPRAMWSLGASGEIPPVRVGRAKRYLVADVHEYIARKRKQAAK